jgi:hypothetical protein
VTQVAGQWSKLNVKNKGPSTRAGYSAGISDSGRVYTFGGYRIAGKDKKRVDLDDTWMVCNAPSICTLLLLYLFFFLLV